MIVPASGSNGTCVFIFVDPPRRLLLRDAPFCPTPKALDAAADVAWSARVFEDAASIALPEMDCVGGMYTLGPAVATRRPVASVVNVAILMYNAEIRQMSGLSSIQIQALVRDMDSSMRRHKGLKRTNPTVYREKVSQENMRLYEEFPTIFEMHIEGKLDETFFEMLKLRQKIEKGEMTDDEASRLIGQKLFDRYVAPVVENTPAPEKPLSYAEFYKQFDNNAST